MESLQGYPKHRRRGDERMRRNLAIVSIGFVALAFIGMGWILSTAVPTRVGGIQLPETGLPEDLLERMIQERASASGGQQPSAASNDQNRYGVRGYPKQCCRCGCACVPSWHDNASLPRLLHLFGRRPPFFGHVVGAQQAVVPAFRECPERHAVPMLNPAYRARISRRVGWRPARIVLHCSRDVLDTSTRYPSAHGPIEPAWRGP
jgi:hypothetical protein